MTLAMDILELILVGSVAMMALMAMCGLAYSIFKYFREG